MYNTQCSIQLLVCSCPPRSPIVELTMRNVNGSTSTADIIKQISLGSCVCIYLFIFSSLPFLYPVYKRLWHCLSCCYCILCGAEPKMESTRIGFSQILISKSKQWKRNRCAFSLTRTAFHFVSPFLFLLFAYGAGCTMKVDKVHETKVKCHTLS